MKNTTGKIPDLTVWGIVKSKVNAPSGLNQNAIPPDCFCANIEVFCCRFNREATLKCCTPSGLKLMSKVEEYHYIKGNIVAVIPNTWYGKVSPIEVKGNLYRQRNKNASFYMTKWVFNDNNTFEIKSCDTKNIQYSDLSEDYKGENLKAQFEKSIVGKSIKHDKEPNNVTVIGVETAGNANNTKEYKEVNEFNKVDKGADLGVYDGLSDEINISDRMIEVQHEIDREREYVENNSIKKKSYYKRTYRNEYKGIKELKDKLYKANSAKEKFLEDNKVDNSDCDMEKYIKYMADNLVSHWSSRPTVGEGSTGRNIITDVLLSLFESVDENIILQMIEEWGIKIVKAWESGNADDIYDTDSCKLVQTMICSNREAVYFKIVTRVLKLKCDLASAYMYNKFSMGEFIENPYLMGIRETRTSIKDMDKMAVVFNNLHKCEDMRNIAYMHYMLMHDNAGNTVVEKSKLLKETVFGFELNKREYSLMRVNNGCWISKDIYKDIQCYINPNFGLNYVEIGNDYNWEQRGEKYIYESNTNKLDVIGNYINSGMGVEINWNGVKYISDTLMYNKELTIYETLYSMMTQKTDKLDEDKIEKYLKEFEKNKSKELGVEFKLENRQREVGYIINERVAALIGPAGSGKTTTEEAYIYCMQRYYDIDEEDFKLAAPSALASERMTECTKLKATTIHKLCNLGVGENGTLSFDLDMIDADVIIIDEMSMVDTELMYELVCRIDEDTKILFVGDIEQLIPIGFGKPFADMLNNMVCIELNVNKRAVENSVITKNSNLIISQKYAMQPCDVENGFDMQIVNIGQDNADSIERYIKEVVLYHLGMKSKCEIETVKSLGVIDKDDIQVVSPVKKDGIIFGTAHLNRVLQNIMNNNDMSSKKELRIVSNFANGFNKGYELDKFIIGDRVVNTMNDDEKIRYKYENGMYKQIGRGISNGTIGKVHDIIKEKSIRIYGEKGSKNSRAGLLIVKIRDKTEENSEYFVMYKFNIASSNGNTFTTSAKINNLELAYALTVHKMQGSEAKLVIGVVLRCGGYGFLNRNMMYTTLTRARKGMYLMGSIKGSASVFNKACKINALNNRTTLLQLISNVEDLHEDKK